MESIVSFTEQGKQKELAGIRIAVRLLIALCCFAGTSIAVTSEAESGINCEGSYGGHLQGIAVDPGRAIYWSFTVEIVKTDLEGRVVKSIEAPSHHGDLTYHNGRIYVAVNLGAFNREPGEADSWVYVYNADNLKLIAKHAVPEVVHGAGGMAYRNDSFIVIGGLPGTYTENYAYEYDEKFSFIKRHVIASGHTQLGIQTAEYSDGQWWFGCYGKPKNKPLIVTDEKFRMSGTSETDFSVGIASHPDGGWYRGISTRDETTKRWTGAIRMMKLYTFKDESYDFLEAE